MLKNTRILTGIIFIILAMVFYAGTGFAQTDSTNVVSNPVSGELNFAALLFKTIVSLAIVIVLLIAFVYGMKWLQSKTQSGYYKYHNMSVQDTLSLGPKKQLHLVQVADRMLLIGSSESNINLLLELDEEEKKQIADKKVKNKPFTKSLSEQMSKLGGSVK